MNIWLRTDSDVRDFERRIIIMTVLSASVRAGQKSARADITDIITWGSLAPHTQYHKVPQCRTGTVTGRQLLTPVPTLSYRRRRCSTHLADCRGTESRRTHCSCWEKCLPARHAGATGTRGVHASHLLTGCRLPPATSLQRVQMYVLHREHERDFHEIIGSLLPVCWLY